MRGLAHGLHAASERDLGFFEQNHLCAGHYCLDSRTAQAIYRQRRFLDWHACLESDVARAVQGVAGRLHGVADDHVVNHRRLDPGALDGFSRCERSKLDSREIAQHPSVFSHRSSGPANYEYFSSH
jgi:hypothetical protein